MPGRQAIMNVCIGAGYTYYTVYIIELPRNYRFPGLGEGRLQVATPGGGWSSGGLGLDAVLPAAQTSLSLPLLWGDRTPLWETCARSK